MKDVARNRQAFHDYQIDETLEAGLVLVGTEVKALREGKVQLKDSHVLIRGGEAFLLNCHISEYSHGNLLNHEPLRTRKLLMNRKEIERLEAKVQQKGYTLIPLRLYFKGPRAKVEVGLARGKKLFEKRDTLKEREARREIERAMKTRSR